MAKTPRNKAKQDAQAAADAAERERLRQLDIEIAALSESDSYQMPEAPPDPPGERPHCPEPPPAEPGRPTIFTQQLADDICERLSCGQSLTAMCRDVDHLPGTTTVFNWLHRRAEFREQYARARANWTEAKVEEMEQISLDSGGDWIMTAKGPVYNREHVDRAKLRIDTLKWIVAKLLPKKWGDKMQLDVVTEVKQLGDEQLNARILHHLLANPDLGQLLHDMLRDHQAETDHGLDEAEHTETALH